ncbi:histidine kinase [Paenibacillus sepulcri]|uniref:Histidine kinase n=1 Tax=Paenibacillus sepulcri TaxID=359917 RepID=A0ABS7BWB5_9BACL|nr:histidine kinase [Paenibacillus sepulcri]
MRWRVKLSSIYPKLLLSFLVVITPIYVLSLKMNEYGERNVRQEIENSIQSRVSFYIHLLDSEFTRIISMQEEYVNDRNLRTLSIADPIISDKERREAIISINNQLNRMINTSPYILNAAAFLPNTHRWITDSTQYSDLPEDEYTALKSINNRYENPFIHWQNRLFISFPYSNLALINGQEPQFLIGVEINQERLKEVLNRFEIGGKGGSMLIDPGGEWAVTSDNAPIPWFDIKPIMAGFPKDSPSYVKETTIDGEKYWFIVERSASHGVTLLSYMPESAILGSLSEYRNWYWALSAISIIVIVLFAYWIFRQIHQPMRRLLRAFQRVENGNWGTILTHRRSDEFGYLYSQFNSMVANMTEMIQEVYEQKYRANLSELRQLQSQINPHFLYNCFFNLYRMAKNEENENIALFSHHLGHYFHYITRTQQDDVPLEEEIKFAQNYIAIQTFRFEDRIAVHLEAVPDSYRAFRVPKLIIQPLLENAYQYGFRNTIADGRLEVCFKYEKGYLIILVDNNGEHIPEPQFQELLLKLKTNSLNVETTGLVNVHRRLKLKYGPDSGLQIVNEPGRFQVRLSIPVEEVKNGSNQGHNLESI